MAQQPMSLCSPRWRRRWRAVGGAASVPRNSSVDGGVIRLNFPILQKRLVSWAHIRYSGSMRRNCNSTARSPCPPIASADRRAGTACRRCRQPTSWFAIDLTPSVFAARRDQDDRARRRPRLLTYSADRGQPDLDVRRSSSSPATARLPACFWCARRAPGGYDDSAELRLRDAWNALLMVVIPKPSIWFARYLIEPVLSVAPPGSDRGAGAGCHLLAAQRTVLEVCCVSSARPQPAPSMARASLHMGNFQTSAATWTVLLPIRVRFVDQLAVVSTMVSAQAGGSRHGDGSIAIGAVRDRLSPN